MAGCLTETDMKRILHLYPDYSQIDAVVESGTFRGETVRLMKNIFREVHTIELSREYFETTSRLEADPRIVFHHGDSVEIFKKLLPGFRKSAIFYLDAHFCHKGTARGKEEVPLLEELKLIVNHPFRDLVIIDDVRLFGTHESEDWTAITKKQILKILRTRIPRWRWHWADHRNLSDRMIVAL